MQTIEIKSACQKKSAKNTELPPVRGQKGVLYKFHFHQLSVMGLTKTLHTARKGNNFHTFGYILLDKQRRAEII